jgi:sugar/nucleoside kinase (ribokinase family)
MHVLRIDERSAFRRLIGVGGIGTGIFFELEGNSTLGRNESRPARLLDVRDYCKLHIVIHYVAKLLGASVTGSPFHVLPVGIVGDDAPGRQMIKEMAESGIDTANVQVNDKLPTLFSVCFQYPDGAGGNLTTSNSAAAALSERQVDGIAGLMRSDAARTIALAVPEVSIEVRKYFLELATDARCFRAASFVPAEIGPAKRAGLFELLDLVALNEEEAGEFVDCAFSPSAPETLITTCQNFLRARFASLKMIVSVGSHGAYGVTAEGWSYCAAPKVEVASTAGAGDSLLGGVLAAIAAGISFVAEQSREQRSDAFVDSALELGVFLASYKCQSPHTIHPEAELEALAEFVRRSGYKFSPRIEESFVQRRPAENGVSS